MSNEVEKLKKELAKEKKFTVKQTSEITGISPRSIYAFIKNGTFPNAKKIGREWQIPEKDIRSYMK